MARTLNSAYVPTQAESGYSPQLAIEEGSTTGHVGVLDLGENINYLWGKGLVPVQILNVWNHTGQGYVSGESSGSEKIHGIWVMEPAREPFTQYTISVRYQNTGTTTPTHDGTLRFDLGSDPYSAPSSGTYVDIPLTANTSQWATASSAITIDPTQTTDSIRMWVINGSSGNCRVHSVVLYPRALTSIPAGAVTTTSSSRRFVPMESDDLDADEPMAVQQANAMLADLETIWKTRPGVAYSYCSDVSESARAGFQTTSSAYTAVQYIPIFAGYNQTSLRWSVIGKRAGSAGAVQLTVLDTASSDEITLGTTWTEPYTAATTLYSDGGQSALICNANVVNWLKVELKGDGTNNAYLYGLCVWFAPQ